MNRTKFICLEGARGTGKSTIAQQLRQSIKNSTLINFTGFNVDGKEGFLTVSNYYLKWLSMFENISFIDQTIICDRIFFSEKVFSKLYKNYDFTSVYNVLASKLAKLNPTIFYLTINGEEELSKRLIRDKIPFHNVEESTKETLKQQDEYNNVFKEADKLFNITTIDTSNLTLEQVKNIIMSKVVQ